MTKNEAKDLVFYLLRFSPRVHSIPRGPLFMLRNDIECFARNEISIL